MSLCKVFLVVAIGVALVCMGSVTQAATVTQQVLINFDGTLAGTTYTLGAGEVDTTASFAASVGSEVVAGGTATLDSSVAGGSQGGEGFFFDATSFNSDVAIVNNFIMEAIVSPTAGFAQGTGQLAGLASILAYGGHGTLRYGPNLPNPPTLTTNFWDGSADNNFTSPTIPGEGVFSHVAVVFDLGGGANVTSSYYLNGVLIGATDPPGGAATAGDFAGFGQEVHSATTGQQRGFDGLLDGVAFSTYTGTFDPATDFQLEFGGVVPDELTLEVNTTTGATRILNNLASSVDINSYQITTSAATLDATRWLSFSDQNLDSVGGGGDIGETWDEAAGAGSHALAESFLLGSTLFDPAHEETLGSAFDPSVLGSEVEDASLEFIYRTTNGNIEVGTVQFVTGGVGGDYNNNGEVEQGDLDLVLLNWGDSSTPIGWINDLPINFPIDAGELDVVRQNWGSTTAAPANSAVPEPASLWMIVMGLVGLGTWRKGCR